MAVDPEGAAEPDALQVPKTVRAPLNAGTIDSETYARQPTIFLRVPRNLQEEKERMHFIAPRGVNYQHIIPYQLGIAPVAWQRPFGRACSLIGGGIRLVLPFGGGGPVGIGERAFPRTSRGRLPELGRPFASHTKMAPGHSPPFLVTINTPLSRQPQGLTATSFKIRGLSPGLHNRFLHPRPAASQTRRCSQKGKRQPTRPPPRSQCSGRTPPCWYNTFVFVLA